MKRLIISLAAAILSLPVTADEGLSNFERSTARFIASSLLALKTI